MRCIKEDVDIIGAVEDYIGNTCIQKKYLKIRLRFYNKGIKI